MLNWERPGEANPTVDLYFMKMDDLNTEIKVNLDVQEKFCNFELQKSLVKKSFHVSLTVASAFRSVSVASSFGPLGPNKF